MRRSTTPILTIQLLTVLVVVASVVVAVIQTPPEPGLAGRIGIVGWAMLPAVLAILGAVIATRQPGNRIAWLIMISALGAVVGSICQVWLETPPTEVTPLVYMAIVVANTAWLVAFLPLFTLLYLFPTGQLPSSWWRWTYWVQAGVAFTIAFFEMFAIDMGLVDGDWRLDNPIGFLTPGTYEGFIELAISMGLVSVVVGGVCALGLRWRHAALDVRTQIKWVVYACVLFVLTYLFALLIETWGVSGTVHRFLLVPAIAAIPISMAVAILRFRLFEIDRIVSRTVAYAVLVGLLAGIYVLVISLFSRFLPGDSDLAVAGSTLAVAALFTPVRRKVQDLVDRRFNRNRYVADHELDEFTNRLKVTTDAAAVEAEVLGLTGRTLQPSSAGMWIKGSDDSGGLTPRR